MKTISKALMFAAVAMAASCAKEINPDVVTPEVELVPMEFVSSIETKTQLASDGLNVQWIAGDEIIVFDGTNTESVTENDVEVTYDQGRKFVAQSAGSATSFTGEAAGSATEYYAVYPYSSSAKMNATSKLMTASLPAQQTAVAGSFADDLSVLVAKADGNTLNFKNVCSLVKFTLASDLTDVKSITLMGNKSEAVAGTFTIDWNDGSPKVEVTKAETYVTLRNADASALAPGDYYFTVLPVDFTEGFTVILSKTDGTQLTKKGASARNVERNKVVATKPLASSDYDMKALNYFVKYNDGFDITVGGYTFNNTTHPGGVLMSDTKGNTGINKDGVYFIDPNAASAQFGSAKAYSKLIVIGADASQRSAFNFYRQARPYEGGTVILMANLKCTVGSKNAFAQNTGTEGHAFATFGEFVLSNCHFVNIGKPFMQFNGAAFTQLDVTIEDCEFGFSGTSVYLINTGSMESTAQNVTISNNIFYAEKDVTMTAFKLIHSDKFTMNNLSVKRNTLVGTVAETNLLRIGDVKTNLDMIGNIFVECSDSDETTKVISLRINASPATLTGTVTNNYYYTTSTNDFGAGIGKSAFSAMTINSAAKLTDSPLSTTWDPANGTFGAYTYPENVSKTVGAWRSDMSVTEDSGADAAAYSYSSVNMGNL